MNNIYLIGFMGSGKTTLAHSLAQVLSMNFIDLDQVVEKKEGMSISEIFNKQGEAYFRQLEKQCLYETGQLKNAIVSTGGGIIGDQANRAFLKGVVTLYLDWPFEVLFKRIAGDKNRPLSKSYEQLYALYQLRLPLYEESATLHMKCEQETPYILMQKAISMLQKGGKI